MKEKFSILLGIVSGCFAGIHAQTITQSWQPTTATVIKVQEVDAGSFIPGAGGTGKTWNFSGLTNSGTPVTAPYAAPAGTPYASSFPTSNLSLAQNVSTVAYYKTSSTSFDLLGVGTSQFVMIYSDPMQQMRFPMSYNSTYKDNYKATYSYSSFDVHRSGYITDTVDGSGTIILPGNKTINDVLRLHLYQYILDSVFMSGNLVQMSISNVETWNYISAWLPGQNLFSYSEILTGTQFLKSASYYNGTLAGIPNAEASSDQKISVYPNPASNNLFVKANEAKISNIIIRDLNGKEVLKTNSIIEGIDISGLNNGIYFIQITKEDGTYSSQKISKE